MGLIELLVILAIVGVLLWLFNTLVPMDGRIKTAINAIVLLVVFIYILQAFGLIHGFGRVRL